MNQNKKTLIVIHGPTAVGKTSVAIKIANQLDAHIFSADSRQLFKEMTIGTAKPTLSELNQVKHHFINHISILEPYSAGKYESECIAKLEEYFLHKDFAILVGGTGMYIDAVLYGLDDFPDISKNTKDKTKEIFDNGGLDALKNIVAKFDPEYYKKVDLKNSRRLERAVEVILESGKSYSSFLNQEKKKRSFQTIELQLSLPREVLYDRINLRVDQMIKDGLIDEVKLLENVKTNRALQTVGYQEIFKYFDGAYELDFAITEIKKNSRRYAKRQLTWLRKKEIPCFAPTDINKITNYINIELNKQQKNNC